jgi:membrane-associated phospholipid phosphatase
LSIVNPSAESSSFETAPLTDIDSPQTQTQDDSSSLEKPYWRTNLFGRFFRDQKFLFTEWWPSEVRRPGFTFPMLAGIALASTSNHTNGEGADLEMEQYIQSESGSRGASSARVLSDVGDTAAGAVLIGTGYLIGRWSHHDQLAEASSLSAEALLSAGLYSTVLKGIAARHRPGDDTNGKFFDYHHTVGSVESFPSGHATGAFTVATVFAGVYSDKKWVAWFAYGTAGLIGASRVTLGRHFPSDVLVGGILGNSIGRMVLAHREQPARAVSSLQPYFDPTGQQAGLVYTRDW